MPNGNGKTRRGLVLADFMNLVLEPKLGPGHRNAFDAKAQLYADALGLQWTCQFSDELAVELERERLHFLDSVTDDEEYWQLVNAAATAKFVDLSDAERRRIGSEIHSGIISDSSLYEVRPDMFQALRRLKKYCEKNGLLLALASNQPKNHLSRMVQEFNLGALFDKQYSFQSVGGARKPALSFWRSIRDLTGLPILAMVGHSLQNDAPGAILDFPVFLHDRTGQTVVRLALPQADTRLSDWVYTRIRMRLLSTHLTPADLIEAAVMHLKKKLKPA